MFLPGNHPHPKIFFVIIVITVIVTTVIVTVTSSDFPDSGLGLDYDYDDGFTLNGICDSFCQVKTCWSSFVKTFWSSFAHRESIEMTGGKSSSNRVWEECSWVWSSVWWWVQLLPHISQNLHWLHRPEKGKYVVMPHTNLLFDNHLKAQKNRVGVTFRRVVL